MIWIVEKDIFCGFFLCDALVKKKKKKFKEINSGELKDWIEIDFNGGGFFSGEMVPLLVVLLSECRSDHHLQS